MLWLLRDHLGLDVTNMEDEESTGVFVLQKLAREREDIALYLKLREKKKLVSSFYDSYLNLQQGGRLYTNFKITGTRTGRLSSADPNMQQVPDPVRPLIIPDKGNVFINYDLSAIEARLIATESGDETLVGLIKKGLSPHDQNGKIFFDLKCAVEEVKKKFPNERQVAKTSGFALYYGAGKNRIRTVFISNNIHKSEKECAEILERFRRAYKGSFKRHKEITNDLERFKLFNAFGRPIIIEDPEDYYMKGYNTIIQSLASDINLFAAMRAQEAFEAEDLEANVLLLVHDSVLVECPKRNAKRAEEILVRELRRYVLTNTSKRVSLPIDCEGGICDKWK